VGCKFGERDPGDYLHFLSLFSLSLCVCIYERQYVGLCMWVSKHQILARILRENILRALHGRVELLRRALLLLEAVGFGPVPALEVAREHCGNTVSRSGSDNTSQEEKERERGTPRGSSSSRMR
jgi:hypothetical protein